jgi:Flp pilus assembly protein CpaB
VTDLRAQLRDLRRAASWHRRLLAAGLAAGAVAAGLHAAAPPPVAGVSVLVADRDLPGGSRLDPADLRTVNLPEALAPASALPAGADLRGAVLAAPLAADEVLTSARLVGPSLLEGYDTTLVGVPVRLADAAVATLLHAGDLVDVLAADPSGVGFEFSGALDGSVPATGADGTDMAGAARVVAPAVRVLAVLADDAGGAFSAGGGAGALIVVAASPNVAADVAGAEATSRLSVALRTG